MTATYPARRGVRECRLYRFWVQHPVTGETVLGYIGETGRQPFERLLEHLATQPWFDTVVRWEVDPQVYWGKQAVLEAEAAAIRTERPLYNYEGNLSNPYRIEIWRAKEQRLARDAQRNRQPWEPRGKATPPAPAPVRARRRWRPWQKSAVVCLAVVLAGWVGLVWRFDFAVWWQPPAWSAGAVTAARLWWRLGRPIRPRTWRRQIRRKLRRRKVRR